MGAGRRFPSGSDLLPPRRRQDRGRRSDNDARISPKSSAAFWARRPPDPGRRSGSGLPHRTGARRHRGRGLLPARAPIPSAHAGIFPCACAVRPTSANGGKASSQLPLGCGNRASPGHVAAGPVTSPGGRWLTCGATYRGRLSFLLIAKLMAASCDTSRMDTRHRAHGAWPAAAIADRAVGVIGQGRQPGDVLPHALGAAGAGFVPVMGPRGHDMLGQSSQDGGVRHGRPFGSEPREPVPGLAHCHVVPRDRDAGKRARRQEPDDGRWRISARPARTPVPRT
jgi:hypothetical protein